MEENILWSPACHVPDVMCHMFRVTCHVLHDIVTPRLLNFEEVLYNSFRPWIFGAAKPLIVENKVVQCQFYREGQAIQVMRKS